MTNAIPPLVGADGIARPVPVVDGCVSTISAAPGRPTLFTTTWCGYCSRLKSQLKRSGVGYDEIDIEQYADGADMVAQANGGNLTVPTVLFSDGSSLTNPSAAAVSRRLDQLSR